MNPYSSLPARQFWRRSVANVARSEFDPVASVKFKLKREDRIATAGSCFAQHISHKLDQIGFNYFVPENGAALPEAERAARNYRVFSARFGNIYTTRQLIQLFEEAYGRRQPQENVWQHRDGRFVDPFRPAIEPDGFESAEAVAAARSEHLQFVREMFEQCDLFIFTLGLTETWLSKGDGSAFPLAPGVSGGDFDESRHAFANLTVANVEADLIQFLEGLKAVNPKVKALLTVSPVPLIATYENRNVLVSTTYSKSVLRVAVETVWRKYDWVDYFPSYEIITGGFNGGVYYEDDCREVNHRGVAHAMRCFLNNYIEGVENTRETVSPAQRSDQGEWQVICDEEAIEQGNI